MKHSFGFVCGIAYSASLIVRMHDEPSLAAELIHESGYRLKDFKKAGADDFDLRIIKKLFKTESILKAKK
jgi:hypothetical protein